MVLNVIVQYLVVTRPQLKVIAAPAKLAINIRQERGPQVTRALINNKAIKLLFDC